MENELKCGFPWAEQMNCAVTVCDREGVIVYMNSKSRQTFCKDGGTLVGTNLFGCHPEHAQQKIRHMLATGESNSYTIQKNGMKKMIYQTPWRDATGAIAGMVEISMVIPAEMPHYIRG
jgi:PAS domain protein